MSAEHSRSARSDAPEPPVAVAPMSSVPASSAEPATLRVQKRDGRETRFDARKIERSVSRAMQASGQADLSTAADVAAVVELSLAHRAAEHTQAIAVEEIGDLVERALVELGRAAVAKAYILYRERRSQVREVLEPARRAASAPARAVGGAGVGGEARVRVHESERSAPWSKARIVAALLREANLTRDAAEDVAARVERRVLDSGLRAISSGLVRALVDNELLELGLTAALRRQEALKLPRHDLRAALCGERPGDPPRTGAHRVRGARAPGLGPWVSGQILRRFALEDVLPPHVAEAHRAGDLHIEDLDAPHLPLWISLPSELLPGDAAGAARAFAVLPELGELAGQATRGLTLEDPAPLLADFARGPRGSLGLEAWLSAVAGVARASGRQIDLGRLGPRAGALVPRLIGALAELGASDGGRDLPRLFLAGDELESALAGEPKLAAAADALLASGALVTHVARRDAHALAPGCARRERERGALACVGAVALDLPQLARATGAWREGAFLEGLAELVQAGLEAARALAALQAEHARWEERSARVRARPSFAIVPVGLREALARLGDGDVDPALGRRALGFLGEAAARLRRSGDPELLPAPFFGERAAARFAALERAGDRREHTNTFPGFGAPDPEAVDFERTALSSGFWIGRLPGWWPGEAEAELLGALGAGAIHPPPAVDPREEFPALSAWRRFRAARARGEGVEKGLLLPLGPRLAANEDHDDPRAETARGGDPRSAAERGGRGAAGTD